MLTLVKSRNNYESLLFSQCNCKTVICRIPYWKLSILDINDLLEKKYEVEI